MAIFGGSGVAVGIGSGVADGVGVGLALLPPNRPACAGAAESASTPQNAATNDAATRIRFKIVRPYLKLLR